MIAHASLMAETRPARSTSGRTNSWVSASIGPSGWDATPTYTDPDPDTSTTHTYYVTSVASNLAESDPAPLPPAQFP